MWNSLKKFDQFGSPIVLNISKKKKGQTLYRPEYQSTFGLALTFLAQTICMAYLIYLVVRMYMLEDDDYKSMQIGNPYDEKTAVLNLTQLYFLPNLAILGSTAFNNSKFDVLKDNAKPGYELDIDIPKFNRYVESNIVLQTRTKGKDSFYFVKMVPCKLEWFPHTKQEHNQEQLSKWLCPDRDVLKDVWGLQGGITDFNFRITAHLQLGLCNPERSALGCAPQGLIEEFLDAIVFQQSAMLGQVALRDKVNPSSNPVSYINWFMHKIKLDPKNFIDQDNFLMYNLVQTRDDRVNFLAAEKEYEFVNYYISPQFFDKHREKVYESATTDRISYKPLVSRPLYQSNFFYSDMMYEHSRDMRNWIYIFSDWGGLQQFLFSFLGIIFSFVNERLKYARLITYLFTETDKTREPFKRSHFKLKLSNVFHEWRFLPCIKSSRKSRKKDMQFEYGSELIDKRLDLVFILRSMQKMMASISVLLHQSPKNLLGHIRHLVINKQTIWDPKVDAKVREKEDKVIEKYLKIYEFLNNSDEEDVAPQDTLESEESKKMTINPISQLKRQITSKFTSSLKEKYLQELNKHQMLKN